MADSKCPTLSALAVGVEDRRVLALRFILGSRVSSVEPNLSQARLRSKPSDASPIPWAHARAYLSRTLLGIRLGLLCGWVVGLGFEVSRRGYCTMFRSS